MVTAAHEEITEQELQEVDAGVFGEDIPAHALRERRDRYAENVAGLNEAFESNEDPSEDDIGQHEHVIGIWNDRIAKIDAELERRESNGEPSGDGAPASGGATTGSTSKKKGGLPKCPITGIENKPGSRFRPGQDAKLKGMISRVDKDLEQPGFRFPSLVIEYARTMPDQMYVGDYSAEFILLMHEKLERGEGVKKPKEEKEKETAEAAA